MKHQVRRISYATGALLLGALLASAQDPGHKGMGMGMGMGMYDTKTETTFKGTVDSAQQGGSGRMMMMMGDHLMVKTGDETREVMLGPSKYVSDQGFTFAKGDAIEVTGSKMTMSGKDSIIAREVVKDGKTLTLRDKTGKPLWAGQMMGRPKSQ